MNFVRNMSIRRKLVLITMVTSVTVLMITSAWILAYQSIAFRSQLVEDLQVRAHIIAENVSATLDFDDSECARQILNAQHHDSATVVASVFRPDGTLFATYTRDRHSQTAILPDMEPGNNTNKDNYASVFRHIVEDGDTVGLVYIVSDLSALAIARKQYLTTLGIMFLVAAVVAFVLSTLLQRIISKPIEDLAHTMQIVTNDRDYSVRATPHGQDELGTLIEGFNEMLVRIQSRDATLNHHRKTLEEQVAVRTAELQDEVTERRRAEDRIRHSLDEKEVLLKEIHHRVKNNLQVISSLLSLQSHSVTDHGVRAMFTDSQSRVKSMALIHEKLYRSADLARIPFGEYLGDLIQHIQRTIGPASRIQVRLDVENVLLDIDQAVSCGLIVNELFSNAMKHAFPDGESGIIDIIFRRGLDETITMTICDNGIGLPDGFVLKRAESLGLKLVSTLTKQLSGEIQIVSDEGTTFTITFPRSAHYEATEKATA